jgi:Family of unknown function (DUF5946)
VRQDRRVPAPRPLAPRTDAPGTPTVTCPGCGSVLAAVDDAAPTRPGASASCAQLFEVTLRGLREDAPADPAAAAVVRLADDAYAAQHPDPADPRPSAAAEETLVTGFGLAPGGRRPAAWRATVADVAADLDVVDLPALVGAWARSVAEDCAGAPQG